MGFAAARGRMTRVADPVLPRSGEQYARSYDSERVTSTIEAWS
jgi:hypothetical protein